MSLADNYKDPHVKAMAEALEAEQHMRDELIAWRNRFPQYVYRRQDGCIALRLPQTQKGNDDA